MARLRRSVWLWKRRKLRVRPMLYVRHSDLTIRMSDPASLRKGDGRGELSRRPSRVEGRYMRRVPPGRVQFCQLSDLANRASPSSFSRPFPSYTNICIMPRWRTDRWYGSAPPSMLCESSQPMRDARRATNSAGCSEASIQRTGSP
jgi:hypothetical protein